MWDRENIKMIPSIIIFHKRESCNTESPLCLGLKNKLGFVNRSMGSESVSRILSWTVIYLRDPPAGQTNRASSFQIIRDPRLFSLAPDGVYRASECCHSERWALTPPFHPYPSSADQAANDRRYIFCGTFRRLTAPSRYEASCPVEFGLSSSRLFGMRPPDSLPLK